MKIKVPTRFDTRIKTRFLLLPKKISNEIRWLEIATWEEVYRPDLFLFGGGWLADRWIDGDPK